MILNIEMIPEQKKGILAKVTEWHLILTDVLSSISLFVVHFSEIATYASLSQLYTGQKYERNM